MTPSGKFQMFFVFIVLSLFFSQGALAESLSESIAAFIATERNFPTSAYTSPSSAFEYSENENSFLFGKTEQPMRMFQFGKINLTTYINARPSFSYQLGKDATLGIKASRDSVRFQVEVKWK